MNHLKTYEGFFSNLFGGKKPFDDPNIDQVVADTLVDLQDNGFEIKTSLELRDWDGKRELIVSIKKFPTFRNGHAIRDFDLSEISNALKFTIPYLRKEVGLDLFDIFFKESKWTHKKKIYLGTTSGTHKLIRYTKLSQVKGDERTSEIKITFR